MGNKVVVWAGSAWIVLLFVATMVSADLAGPLWVGTLIALAAWFIGGFFVNTVRGVKR